MTKKVTIQAFISYAHEDRPFFKPFYNNLDKLLAQSERFNWQLWEDSKIPIGSDWDKMIQQNLMKAQVGIFLLSSNFFSSNYIKDKEFSILLEKSTQRNVLLIPVLLCPCNYSQWSDLAKRQIFMPRGEEFDKPDIQSFTFSDLVKFREKDGLTIPNPNIQRYVMRFVEQLEYSIQTKLQLDATPAQSTDKFERYSKSCHVRPSKEKPRIVISGVKPLASPLFGRTVEMERLLKMTRTCSFSIRGMKGIGKSKMLSALFDAIKDQKLSRYQTCCWVGLRYSSPPSFADFAKIIAKEVAGNDIENPTTIMNELPNLVIEILKANKCFLAIDQFETVIDRETSIPRDVGFGELLRYARQGIHPSNMIVTSWEVPIDCDGVDFPHFDIRGIDANSSINLLGDILQKNNKVQFIAEAPDLKSLLRSLSGHPLAIEILASNLSEDFIIELRSDSLLARMTTEEIANKVIAHVYRRILSDQDSTTVLKGLAVARGPIDNQYIEHVTNLQPITVRKCCQNLLKKSIIYKASTTLFDTHALVRDFLSNEMQRSELIDLNRKAAQFFYSCACKLKAPYTKSFIDLFLSSMYHLLTACDYREAMEKIINFKFDELLYEKGYHIQLLNLYEEIPDEELKKHHLSKMKGNKSRIFRDLADYEKAIKFAEEALDLARSGDDNTLIIEELINCGDIYYYSKTKEEALKLLNEAISNNHFSEIDPKLAGRAYGCMGNVYSSMKDIESSISCYNKGIELARNANDTRYIGIWTGDMALLHIKEDRNEKAMALLKKAIELAESAGDKMNIGLWENHLAGILVKEGDTDSAINRYQKALTISIMHSFIRVLSITVNSILVLCQDLDSVKLLESVLRKVNTELSEECHSKKGVIPFLDLMAQKVCHNAMGMEERGEYLSAIEEYGRYSDISLLEFYIRAQRARCFRFLAYTSVEKENLLQNALDDYERAIQLVPDNEWYHLLRAAVLAQKGDSIRAIEGYDNALFLNPDNIMTILGKAESQICLDAYYEASATLQDIADREIPVHQRAILLYLNCIIRALLKEPYADLLSDLQNIDAKLSNRLDWCTVEIDEYLKTMKLRKSEHSIAEFERIHTVFKNKFIETPSET